MNRYRLMRGDCLERMKEIPDNYVDMILCDLPYGTTACKWDIIIPLNDMWTQYRRIAKPRAAIVLMASQPFTTALISSNLKEFRYEWIWVKDRKTGPMTAKIMPMKGHEVICVFGKQTPQYFRLLVKRDKPITARVPKSKSVVYANEAGQTDEYRRRTDTKCPDTVLYFATERGLHPTQKPVALMEYLIKTYTIEGDTVLDNCMGSGTTGIACLNTNRKFIGIELDRSYYRTARDRLEKHLKFLKDELRKPKLKFLPTA